jgi:hypothetical protein
VIGMGGYVLEGWVAKLVDRLLVTTSFRIYGRHKLRYSKHTVARQKIVSDKKNPHQKGSLVGVHRQNIIPPFVLYTSPFIFLCLFGGGGECDE